MRRLREAGQPAATTIVCCEEQIRGWMASLARQPSLKEQVEGYRRLRRQLESYCKMQILEFDERAAAKYQEMKKARLRVGTMDLKIAAITLVRGGMLLTGNLRDFAKVPGLQVKNWEQL